MKNAEQLHREAMALAEQADFARMRGNQTQHQDLIRQAFELEAQAAHLVAGSDLEPTRSVLHQSAASLALEAAEYREAERLAGVALGGAPPAQILNELRSLLQDIHFRQHVAEDGMELEANEVMFTMIGGQVGEGIAPSDEFLRRVDLFDKLVFRSAERRAGKPFRTQGRRDKTIQEGVELFIKVPEAASFAVTFKLGRRGLFREMDDGVHVVQDLVRSFDLFARAEVEPLRKLIPEPSYYKNFVALARKLTPDGSKVGRVGLVAKSGEQPVSVLLTPSTATTFDGTGGSGADSEEVQRIEVTGTLLLADAVGKKWGKIQVVPDEGDPVRFLVDPEMMADIVRPYFDQGVQAVGHRKGKSNYLDDISPE